MQARRIKKHVPLVKRHKIAKRMAFLYDLGAILLGALWLALLLAWGLKLI